MKQPAVLGLDTSNYRTSAACVSVKGEILADFRELLPVEAGCIGLRQSEALFAHLRQLNRAENSLRKAAETAEIVAVAASVSPRDGAESYMPVFLAGASFGGLMASAMGVPFVRTTHQRGHLAAACRGTGLENSDRYLAVHLSGGTTDLLKVAEDRIDRIGGSEDLHAGQLVDRAGVAMGLSFPAGPELELLAAMGKAEGRLGCSMEDGGLRCHFSGAETQVQRWIREGSLNRENIAMEIYDLLARTIIRMVCAGAAKTGLKQVLITGGVASSAIFRRLTEERRKKQRNAPAVFFGAPEMSGDNAIGVAMIGVREILKQNSLRNAE